MAGVKVTALAEATSISTDDLIMIIDDPAGSEANKKATFSNVIASIPEATTEAKGLMSADDKTDYDIIVPNFDTAGDGKLKPTGLQAQTKTVLSLISPVPDYIGQPGIDARGTKYRAEALTGNVWSPLFDGIVFSGKSSKSYSNTNFDVTGIYTSAGDWSTSSNWRTKIIYVNEGEIILYRLYSGNGVGLITYLNAAGAVISQEFAPDNNRECRVGYSTVPATAVRAAIGTFDANKSDSYLTHYKDNYAAIFSKSTLAFTTFNIAGLYISGSWNVSTNWASALVDINAGEEISYVLYSTTAAHLLTFLDASNNIISSILSAPIATSVEQSGTVIAPIGTAKVMVTTYNANKSSSSYSLTKNNEDIFEQKGAIVREITVDKTAPEDAENFVFNTLTDALAVATGTAIIYIYGDFSSPYEEFHLTIPDGLTIIGVGTPWIKGEQTEDETVANITNLSTLEAYFSFTLENLIISCKNARYPIHADFSSGKSTKIVKNCKFIHYGNDEAYAYHEANVGDEAQIMRAMSAWGGGTKAGDIVLIDGSYFESNFRAFSTHNNVDFDLTYGASFVKVTNSIMRSHGIDRDGSNLGFLSSAHIQNLASNTNDKIIFENCEINGYITIQGTLTHDVFINSVNLKQVYNSAGGGYGNNALWTDLDVNTFIVIKDEINYLKNTSGSTITRGKAVKLSGIGFSLYTASDSVNDFYGILLEETEAGKTGAVKFTGYLPWKYFDGTNYAITDGADVSVNSMGDFVQDSSHIVCVAVDNYNVKIK